MNRYEEIKARVLQEQASHKTRKKGGHEEDNLQTACVRWIRLQHPKLVIHHSPNEGIRSERQGGRLKTLGMHTGWPDLEIAYPDGRILFIEFKTDKGRQSEAQKQTELELKSLGHAYHIVRSLEEFITHVNNYGRMD